MTLFGKKINPFVLGIIIYLLIGTLYLGYNYAINNCEVISKNPISRECSMDYGSRDLYTLYDILILLLWPIFLFWQLTGGPKV
jgi:hypothetical protein